MKEIFILRHAKSSWDNINLSDFERPLAKRGINDANTMSDYLRKKNFSVDKVLCSNATRTKETLDIISDGIEFEISDARYTDDLYFKGLDKILGYLRKIDEETKSILIIGHNPTLHFLIETLTKEHIHKFATCNMAIINFNNNWKNLSEGECKLELIIKPKEIKL